MLITLVSGVIRRRRKAAKKISASAMSVIKTADLSESRIRQKHTRQRPSATPVTGSIARLVIVSAQVRRVAIKLQLRWLRKCTLRRKTRRVVQVVITTNELSAAMIFRIAGVVIGEIISGSNKKMCENFHGRCELSPECFYKISISSRKTKVFSAARRLN